MLYKNIVGTKQNPYPLDLSGQQFDKLQIQDSHNVLITANPNNPLRIDVTNPKAKAFVASRCTGITFEHFELVGRGGDYMSWDAAQWANAPVRAIAGIGTDDLTVQDGTITGFRSGVQIIGDNATIQRLKIRGVGGDAIRGYGNDLSVLFCDTGDFFKFGANHLDHYQGSEHRGKGPFYRITIRGNLCRSIINNAGHPLSHPGGQGIFQKAQAGGIVYYDVVIEDNKVDTAGFKAFALRGVERGIVRNNIILSADPGGLHPRLGLGNIRDVLVENNIIQQIVERGGVEGLVARNNRRLDGTLLPSIAAVDDDDDDYVSPPPDDDEEDDGGVLPPPPVIPDPQPDPDPEEPPVETPDDSSQVEALTAEVARLTAENASLSAKIASADTAIQAADLLVKAAAAEIQAADDALG